MKKHLFFALSLVLLTFASQVEAVTRYVAKTCTGGGACVDSVSCTQAQSVGTAKLTIAAGIACLASGDTLSIGNGVYVERIANNVPSGTSWATATTIKSTNPLGATLRPTGNVRVVNFDDGGNGGTTHFAPSYIIIDGLVLDGINTTTAAVGVAIEEGSDHIRVQNCEIKNAFYSGVGIFSGGVAGSAHSNEILNNLIHDNGRDTANPSLHHGIYVSSTNTIVQGNTVYNNKSYGIQLYSGSYGQADLAGVQVLSNNIYANSTWTTFYAGIIATGTSTTVIANNIIRNNPGPGIRLQYGGGCDACKVYSNTIYQNTQDGILINGDTNAAEIRNNIIYLNTGAAITDGGSSTAKFNNLTTNPQFVNAPTDLRIQSNSQAKDAGLTLGPPYNIDFAGISRPQGSAYDIGAYEFLTASAPAAPTSPTATPGDTQVTVGWTASAGATSYTVLRSTTSGGGYSVVQSGISASPYVNTGLTNGTTYYYVIQAVNVSGSSPNSAQASATPLPPAPSAPTGLSATAGDTQISLVWTATAGAVTYNVLRSTTSGSGYSQIVSGLASPSYLNTGLTNGTTYYYVVQAVNSSGTSPNSAQAGETPTSPPPPIAAPPTNFIATAGDTQISLSWTASTGAVTYTLKRGTVSGGPYGTTVISGLATTTYVDTGLTNGTPYYYVVTAVNAGGESGNSTQAVATPQIPGPDVPTDLSATAGDGQVSLAWTTAAGATSYSVYQATVTGGPYGAPVTTGNTAASHTVTGLTNGTPYFFVVTAVNAGGESVFSAEVTATPQYGTPSAPTGLGITASNAQVTVSWTASAGAASYTVLRALTSGGTVTQIASGITNPTYTDISVLNGVPYYYVVAATNSSGTSSPSAEIAATPRVVAVTHIIGTTRTIGSIFAH